MIYARLRDIPTDVSRLGLGTSGLRSPETAFPVYDQFAAVGGTLIDTACVYGGGQSEEVLGAWLGSRGARDAVVIVGKGAHPPDNVPAALGRDLHRSLDRLGTERLDIYLAHRDNLDVPVDEFVDALAQLVDDGLIASYGLSNWTLPRADEALSYATGHGRPQPSVISNHYSLLTMETPIHPGCLSAKDPAWEAWLDRTGLVLAPFSSQGRGFLSCNGSGWRPLDERQRSPWLSYANLARRQRARLLAELHGCEPIQVALAYVLGQPGFQTLPLIGPQNEAELLSSVGALDVSLSEAEMAWLDSGIAAEGSTIPAARRIAATADTTSRPV